VLAPAEQYLALIDQFQCPTAETFLPLDSGADHIDLFHPHHPPSPAPVREPARPEIRINACFT
jgi:hypothetical protein